MTDALRAAGLLASLSLAAACNPLDFDDLKDQTWVDASGTPDGLDSRDWGVGVGFGGSGGDGLVVVGVARTPGAIGRVKYDAAGDLSTDNGTIASAGDPVNQLADPPAVAGDPLGFDLGFAVAVGASETMTSSSLAVLVDPKKASLTIAQLPLSSAAVALVGDPAGLAYGHAGGEAEAELAGVVGDALSLTLDASKEAIGVQGRTSVCTLPSEATAVAMADLDGDGADEIVVGLASGSVVVLAVAGVVDAAPCVALQTVALDTAGAIRAIATGDLDGSGAADLVFGQPDGDVVVVVLDPGAGGGPTTLSSPSGGRFGSSLAVGDYDGDGKDDLAVGDPTAEVDGVFAGAVYLYPGADALELAATLHDASPEDDQQFGQAVTAAAFDDTDDVLVVGADEELFTYFQNPLGGEDVRR